MPGAMRILKRTIVCSVTRIGVGNSTMAVSQSEAGTVSRKHVALS